MLLVGHGQCAQVGPSRLIAFVWRLLAANDVSKERVREFSVRVDEGLRVWPALATMASWDGDDSLLGCGNALFVGVAASGRNRCAQPYQFDAEWPPRG